MEKTAVDWLVEQLDPNIMWTPNAKELYKQAKEMEDTQRKKDFKAGNDSACMEHEDIEDYFNQYIKQETIEEAAEKCRQFYLQNNMTINQIFEAGAKWKQERMYSEEDIRNAIDYGARYWKFF